MLQSSFFRKFALLQSKTIKNFMYDPSINDFTDDVFFHNCNIFPGSFNPLTHGHMAIKKRVEELSLSDQKPPKDFIFELSLSNADKGTKTADEYLERLSLFIELKQKVLFTNCSLFFEKLCFFENACFVVGSDTLSRILDEKYYENFGGLENFRETVVSKNSRFLLFPRFDKKKNLCVNLAEILNNSNLSPHNKMNWQLLVSEVLNFRIDISSTEIRNGLVKNQVKDFDY